MLPVFLMAFGNTAGLGVEVITLSGTTGSPISSTDTDYNPNNAFVEWNFRSDGTVDLVKGGSGTSQYQAGIQWSNYQTSPGSGYYIRFTLNADDSPVVNGGADALGDILIMTSDNSVRWSQTGTGTRAGSVKVEIGNATMSTIHATGYYGGTAQVNP